jgi:hypothetical protein
MLTALVSYQFEEDPVRVVMIAGDPWFVASDLAKALGYRDAGNMVRNLHEDERGTHIVSTPSSPQEMSIVSESGMYAAIFKSRKEEAERFRKWVTAEVLPELRRTGRYVMHDMDPPPMVSADLDPPRLLAGVSVVREARRLFGPQAARNLWVQVGLPPVIADAEGDHSGDPLADPLKIWLEGRAETTIQQAADGIGLQDIDWPTRYRIGKLLKMWGWNPINKKIAKHQTARVFQRPASLRGEMF